MQASHPVRHRAAARRPPEYRRLPQSQRMTCRPIPARYADSQVRRFMPSRGADSDANLVPQSRPAALAQLGGGDGGGGSSTKSGGVAPLASSHSGSGRTS